MDNPGLWRKIESSWRAIQAIFQPQLASLYQDTKLESPEWGVLIAALNFEPDFITPAHLMVRSPFMAAEALQERLSDLQASGFLKAAFKGKYRLTEEGRSAVRRFIHTVREAMVAEDPLSRKDGARLAMLLDRLLAAVREQPPPPNHWSLDLSYKLMPALKPPMPFIEQVMTCLNAYWNDAYIHTWRESGMSATSLEILTLLWHGEAQNFDQICACLAHRGHDCRVYEDVVRELISKDLIDEGDDAIWITTSGRIFRNQIEAETENLFYKAWDVLSTDEKNELAGLLDRLELELTHAVI